METGILLAAIVCLRKRLKGAGNYYETKKQEE
jgi:hypothetical protein